MNKILMTTFTALVALFSTPALAVQGSSTGGPMTVSANGIVSCGTTVSAMDFGDFVVVDPTSSVVKTFNIYCNTAGWSVYLDIDLGQNHDGTNRRMLNGTSYLSYGLYQQDGTDFGPTALLGPASATTDATGSASIQVTGKMLQGPNLIAPGAYKDTVIVTVSY